MFRFVVICAAGGLALLVVLLAQPGARPTEVLADRGPQSPASESRALVERVAHLEHELERLSAQLDALARAEGSAPRAVQAEPIEPQASEATPLVGVAPLSQALELESHDNGWEQDVADYFQARLSDPRWSQSSLLRIDCRSTLCRVQLEHESTEAAAAFLAGLSLAELGVGSYTAEQDASGEHPVWTLVLLRRGAALPTSS